jgi:hypothetical protein
VLSSIASLISETLQSRAATEAAARNALNKMLTSIEKLLASAPDAGLAEVSGEDEKADIPDAPEEGVVTQGDLTMLTRPDHEGTVFADYDDEDEDEMEAEEDEEVDVTTGLSMKYVRQEDSLMDSLLGDDTMQS